MVGITSLTSASSLTIDSTVRLSSGIDMPLFGLGTWLSAGEGECLGACKAALEYGYHLIDTSSMYENEQDVGAALADSPRKDVFVVTKLKPADHGRENALAAIDLSLKKLKRSSVDLWLMHTPSGGRVVETWKAMLEAKAAGKCRAVGVSNFGVEQLRQLKAAGCETPEVNQIELHVWLQQRPAVEYCRSEGITVMSYCPLARCKLFGQTELAKLAAEWGRTEPELALRWLLQRGFITIPKSSNAKRVASNAVFGFSLSEEQLAALDALDQGFKGRTASITWTSHGMRSSK